MIRRIIQIDTDKCNGCGVCASACHEGAIVMENGKARLLRDDYCDGLGDCLPACPVGAITFVRREAAAYDADAVKGRRPQWPMQIRLLPEVSALYQDADFLIAADCTAYACREFHQRFTNGHTVGVGCPKLDAVDYSRKLERILAENQIRSLTVVKMEVPCCNGIERAARKALEASGKDIPFRTVTVSVSGEILS